MTVHPPPIDRAMRRRVQLSAYLGALIEWYDFYLYGYAAAVVLNKLFFPSVEASTGVIAAFATFAVGFLARPLGGVVFGYFGDRVGRRGVLVVTLLTMGIATTLIGMLPTYAAIGMWAPILLVVLRVVQGISAGGEFAGAILMTVEHAEPGRRGVASSVAQIGLYSGVILANGVLLLVSLLPPQEFLSWGWRVPFLGSVLLVAVALWIRLGITESPVFEEAKRDNTLARNPLGDLFRTQWRVLLTVVALMLGIATTSAFQGAFIASYAVALKFTTSNALVLTLVGTACAMITLPIAARVSDRVGRKRVAAVGAILILLASWLAFVAVGTRSLPLAIVGAALPPIAHSIAYGPIGAWMSELFPTRNRYGGVSIGYQVSATLGAGFFPLIGASLLAVSGGAPNFGLVYAYLALTVVITLIGIAVARETSRTTLAHTGDRHGAGRFVEAH